MLNTGLCGDILGDVDSSGGVFGSVSSSGDCNAGVNGIADTCNKKSG